MLVREFPVSRILSYIYHIANTIRLNGFGAGPAETIAPAVISDIFFLHDRGKYNTLYFVTYFGALMVCVPAFSFSCMLSLTS